MLKQRCYGILNLDHFLLKEFPRLRIVDIHYADFDKIPSSRENIAIIRTISAARPNILIVSLGMARQECRLMENCDRIEASIALSDRAVFDYVCGQLRRAPRCFRLRLWPTAPCASLGD